MDVKVCMGMRCVLMGSMTIYDQIEDLLSSFDDDPNSNLREKINLEAVKCLDYCKNNLGSVAPVVIIGEEVIFNATGQQVMEKISKVISE